MFSFADNNGQLLDPWELPEELNALLNFYQGLLDIESVQVKRAYAAVGVLLVVNAAGHNLALFCCQYFRNFFAGYNITLFFYHVPNVFVKLGLGEREVVLDDATQYGKGVPYRDPTVGNIF